jgi:hypothetical protein
MQISKYCIILNICVPMLVYDFLLCRQKNIKYQVLVWQYIKIKVLDKGYICVIWVTIKLVQGCVHMSIFVHVYMCLSINIGLIHQLEQNSSYHMFLHDRNFVYLWHCNCVHSDTAIPFSSYILILTFSCLMTYIYMSYGTVNLQMLHCIYLFNKYTYWIF